MGIKHFFSYLFLLTICFCQTTLHAQSKFGQQIDSFLATPTQYPFNGVIRIVQNGKTLYETTNTYRDVKKSIPVNLSDNFLIGSISKQITAVLVLRAYEKGQLDLQTHIRKYLPQLTQPWADTVTVHHLLTHTHGINDTDGLNRPLVFPAGSKFAYSQTGYELLTQILEKVSGQSFAALSTALFKECGMSHTFHPSMYKGGKLAKGYVIDKLGNLNYIGMQQSLDDIVVASGGFISTAHDLQVWNDRLHNGKILKPETYRMMITPQPNAIREHPLFGLTKYGYGISVDDKDGSLQLGQTGLVPGYASMDFYYPNTRTHLIILQNTTQVDNTANTFAVQLLVQKLLRSTKP
ncbi:MAG: class A beta-lactamase-related serine hydrolase [Sphingobacteriales bacterium]|nr:MAG: class A beta-lactamase-related serine hydrolase [Sphingobacteriales bacterium]